MRLGETSFTQLDQERFADLSGDRNPMHLDPVEARRTQAGAPVVHGMHAALWALDALVAVGEEIGSELQIRFEAFIYLEVPITAILRGDAAKRSVVIESGGRRVATIGFPLDRPVSEPIAGARAEAIPVQPLELDFSEASAAEGAIKLRGEASAYSEVFPNLSGAIGADRVRAIAGLSTLVGMRLPGLHSIFSRCRIGLRNASLQPGNVLSFAVQRAREPLRQLTIAFSGSGVSGTIDAFVRHAPVAQPSLEQLAGAMDGLDLRGQRALVVGGSRGLGELTAKIAALAGAEVTITYAAGEREAVALCTELERNALSCNVLKLDVTRLDDVSLAPGQFTHVYYFATPPIFKRVQQGFDAAQFALFNTFYSSGFAELCHRLKGDTDLAAFWPSSTAIDDMLKGAPEYIAAKVAGEALCHYLDLYEPGLRVQVQRLPRLQTDQTASVTPAKTADAETVVRNFLAEMA